MTEQMLICSAKAAEQP